jgi:hypothetical protein
LLRARYGRIWPNSGVPSVFDLAFRSKIELAYGEGFGGFFVILVLG